jgi:hypothetical protein
MRRYTVRTVHNDDGPEDIVSLAAELHFSNVEVMKGRENGVGDEDGDARRLEAAELFLRCCGSMVHGTEIPLISHMQ